MLVQQDMAEQLSISYRWAKLRQSAICRDLAWLLEVPEHHQVRIPAVFWLPISCSMAHMAACRALPVSPCRCYHFCHNPMYSPGIFSCLRSSQPASAPRAATTWHGTDDARAVFSLPRWQLSSSEVWALTALLSSSARMKCIAARTVLPRDVY